MNDCSFSYRALNIHTSHLLTALFSCYMFSCYHVKLLWSVPLHFMQSHIRRVHDCLALTSHLHVWQNDRDLLCATAVTQGWNGHRNKSQHRKLTLEKKFPAVPFIGYTCFQQRGSDVRNWLKVGWALCVVLKSGHETELYMTIILLIRARSMSDPRAPSCVCKRSLSWLRIGEE